MLPFPWLKNELLSYIHRPPSEIKGLSCLNRLTKLRSSASGVVVFSEVMGGTGNGVYCPRSELFTALKEGERATTPVDLGREKA